MAHCLIGKSITSLLKGNLLSVPDNRLSTWQHIKGAAELLGAMEPGVPKRTAETCQMEYGRIDAQ